MRHHVRPFSERVIEMPAGRGRLLVLPTSAEGIVSVRASFRTRPQFQAGEEIVQDLVVRLLDKGTRRHDRFELADILDSRGIQLQFYSDGLRVGFSGRALRDDLDMLLSVAAEQLAEPIMAEEEFEKARQHAVALVRRSLESTAAQAAGALSRRLFSSAHPSYRHHAEEELALLDRLTVADLRAYHEHHFGSNELLMAAAGDVSPDALARAVDATFGHWQPTGVADDFAREARLSAPGREVIILPDKHNVDVRLGHALAIRRQDSAYVPLYLAVFILGGNFSSRLMSTIRDQQGLTYGINASLGSISTEYDGFWQVAVTLSTGTVENGILATLDEVRRFLDGGITEAELEAAKTTVTGSFQVGLATTTGLAVTLLTNAERGFAADYLDRFPREVQEVVLQRVHENMAAYLHIDQLHTVLAGVPDPVAEYGITT